VSTDRIESLPSWKHLQASCYHIHAHPDLEVTRIENGKKCLILFGSIFDPYSPRRSNDDILRAILFSVDCFQSVFPKMKRYAGSYAIFYLDEERSAIWSDARGSEEIFYCTQENRIVCGSQANLIARFADPQIKPSSDPLLIDFYDNYLWDSRWVGDETYFDGIKHLLPNHYLDLGSLTAYRYWPDEPIKQVSLEEAVIKSCNYLQGVMKSITHRHKTIMAVTAGIDSRILVAASKPFLRDIFCFINDRRLGDSHPDVRIPNEMFDKIGQEFHVHKVPENVDPNFRKFFFTNTFLADERLLPSIYNVFYKIHSDKVLILGITEIGRNFYGLEPKGLDSYRIASKLTYEKCPYVIKECEKYLNKMLPVARKYRLNPMDIIYWEQRLGNCGGVRNSESKIAIQKVDPCNSHYLNEVFLGVDPKHRMPHDPIFFKEIARKMWPDLLNWPINPPFTMRERIVDILIKLGVFDNLKEIKYQVNHYFWKTWH